MVHSRRLIANPFPGPQPYTDVDRDRFFGRDAVIRDLTDAVLSHRVLTVFGPSGAGKSSVLQAGLAPTLAQRFGLRVVNLDAWPQRQIIEKGPVSCIVGAMARQLSLGDLPDDDLDEAIELAFLASDRPVLLILDQLEQLLATHETDVLRSFVLQLAELELSRAGTLHVVLALREDYLGRWAARLTEHPSLVRHTYRVKRLTVDEVLVAVERTAASAPTPQLWKRDRLVPFIDSMVLPGEWRADGFEVESAYVQIVCRKLFEMGGPEAVVGTSAAQILERYLGDTLTGLGRLEAPARNLLENHLIHASSGRRLQVARPEVTQVVGGEANARQILATLEGARILRAQDHQGEQLFELGHDWLAAPIRQDAARKRERARRAQERRRLAVFALILMVFLVVATALLGLYLRADRALALAEQRTAEAEAARAAQAEAKDAAEQAAEAARVDRDRAVAAQQEADAARTQAELARTEAQEQRAIAEGEAKNARVQQRLALEARDLADDARSLAERRAQEVLDAQRLRAVRELSADPTRAAPFLRDVDPRSQPDRWRAAAWDVLQRPLSSAVGDVALVRPSSMFRLAPAHGWVAAPAAGQRVVVWPTTGGAPVYLATPADVVSVALSAAADVMVVALADGQIQRWARDGGAWTATAAHASHTRPATVVAISADGRRIATGGPAGEVLLWDGSAAPTRIPHGGPVWSVAFDPAGVRLLTSSADGAIAVWSASTGAAIGRLREVTADTPTATAAAFDAAGERVVGAWADGRIVVASAAGAVERTLSAPKGYVAGAAFAAGLLLTRDRDGELAVWVPEADKWVARPLVVGVGAVRQLAVAPDGRHVVVGGPGGAAVRFELTGQGLVRDRTPLDGHSADLVGVGFDGDRAVTASEDQTLRAWPSATPRMSRLVEGLDGREVTRLAYDGTTLVATLRSGERRALAVEGYPVGPAVAAPDVRAGPDGDVSVSEHDGEPIVLVGHLGPVGGVAVRADGRQIATASADGTVLLWDIPGDAGLVERLGEHITGCARPQDRVRFLGESRAQAEAAAAACAR